SQYRLHFASLADHYLTLAEAEEMTKKSKEMNVEMLRKSGANKQADSLQISLEGVDDKIRDFRKKAINLLDHSLKVMPAEFVIDYGEPTSSRETYKETGLDLPVYQDGILHDYVALYYRAGNKKAAEKLGAVVAGQLESILNYFEKSDAYFAGNAENSSDLWASLDAYFKLHMAAIDPVTGNKSGQL
ncbi:MAG: hypothetical protein ACK45H_08065, partial [Bacteroidota bacterium]